MTMSETAHRWLLWAGVVAVILVLRVGCVLYERSRPFPQKAVVEKPIDRDRLVVVPKFYVEDFASARQLVGKTLWVKLGYVTGYFLDKPRVKPANRELRYFQPLESLAIESVMERQIPGEAGNKRGTLPLSKGRPGVADLGRAVRRPRRPLRDATRRIVLSQESTRALRAWGEDAWSKIEKHSLEPGMTLTQALFSLGYGRLVTTEAGGIQLHEFGRKPGGEPGKTRIRFLDGRVKEFRVLQ